MLKKYSPKYSTGSLYICTKCSQTFNESQIEFAENLKVNLRKELKSLEAHSKIRVMTSGCIGVCQSNEQAFGYYPHEGQSEVFTVSNDLQVAQNEILGFIKSKL